MLSVVFVFQCHALMSDSVPSGPVSSQTFCPQQVEGGEGGGGEEEEVRNPLVAKSSNPGRLSKRCLRNLYLAPAFP